MLSPEVKASFRRFKSERRAYHSLRILVILFLISLPAELLCNQKPLIIIHSGRTYFPVLRRYTELDFGGSRAVTPDYRSARFLALIGHGDLGGADKVQAPGLDSGGLDGKSQSDILLRFDPEPWDVSAPAVAILDRFDPEVHDVPLSRDPAKADIAVARQAAVVVWAPVRYDYAYIDMRRRVGRDALASPWGQVIPGSDTRTPSSWAGGHYLGTDDRGRDVLARLVYGFRVSLLFGITLACYGTVAGCVLGALQGFFGGWVDLLGQRLTEIWGSMPQLYLLMILSALLARSILVLFFILTLTSWMGMAAYMRAEFLRGRNLDYVRAARALGVSNLGTMFRHILPNSLTPIITFFPFAVTGGILALVSLDFLGLGVASPFPSLGELLAQGRANLHATWIILPTFLVLSGTVTLLTFIGDGLRNAFDPRRTTRGSHAA